jgi:hypothetical protein
LDVGWHVGHSRFKKMMQGNCKTSFNVPRFHAAAKACST